MVDRELLRQQPQPFRESVQNRGLDPSLVDQCLDLDVKWRDLVAKVDALRAERNTASRAGKPSPSQLKEAKLLAKKLTEVEAKLKQAEAALDQTIIRLPNLIAADVPVGAGESANEAVQAVG